MGSPSSLQQLGLGIGPCLLLIVRGTVHHLLPLLLGIVFLHLLVMAADIDILLHRALLLGLCRCDLSCSSWDMLLAL